MLKDFKKHDISGWCAPDVCIIGAGAAGITIARELARSDLRVLLLESGGREFDKQAQSLADGTNVGFDYYELQHARLRFFGGTTAIWGGRCAELDDIDFEARDWVPHSGWPIQKSDLAPYYARARASLNLPDVSGNRHPGTAPAPMRPDRIVDAYWQFDDRFDRFTLRNCRDLTQHPRVNILLNATVAAIHLNTTGNTVASIEIANHQGRMQTLRPVRTILATGGLENARLLLASNIGNTHDQVGRYFMEHPQARGSRINPIQSDALRVNFPSYSRHEKVRYGLLFRPSEAEQAREGILNTSFSLRPARAHGRDQVAYTKLYTHLRDTLEPTRLGRTLWASFKRASRFAQSHLLPHLMSGRLKLGSDGIFTVIRAEQAPNPNSRVKLGTKRDALDIPKIELDWQLSDIDKRSARHVMHAFDAELRKSGIATTELADWLHEDGPIWQHDPLISNHAKGGFHHMGTTRMGSAPQTSVVDANCRVHGVENLYVAGSSVFSTSGWANPTLTILALSIRLADEICDRAKGDKAIVDTAPMPALQQDVLVNARASISGSGLAGV